MLLAKINSVDPDVAAGLGSRAGAAQHLRAKALQPSLILAKQKLSAIMRNPIPTAIRLQHDVSTVLELQPKSVATVVRGGLSGLLPPARFKIEYLKDKGSKLDLTIYLSFRNRRPDAADNDKAIRIKPKTLTVHEYDRNLQKVKEFTTDHIFLSFVSEAGGALALTHQVDTVEPESDKMTKLQT